VTPRAKLLLAALALAAAALVAARWPRAPESAAAAMASPGRAPHASAAVAAATPVDPATIRDLFRFAERPAPAAARSQPRPAATALPTPAPDLPKLVGLVRRKGKLLAAFSQAGEVMLAGPGDTAAGVTVVDVSEDGVRVRRKDGSEELLRVP
jgi:hypothetical protein